MPGETMPISDVTGKSMLTRPPLWQAAFFPDLPMARVAQGFMRAETQLQRARRNRPKRQTFRRFAPMRVSDPFETFHLNGHALIGSLESHSHSASKAAVTALPHSERIISEMPAETKKPLEALRNAALTTTGLIMAAIPLALWVAWPQATFVLGVGAGAAFGLLVFVLYADTRATNEEQCKDSGSRTMEYLDDEFLSELSDMGPFIYHHGPSGDSRFRRKMARLKKKLVTSNSRRPN